MPIPDGHLPAVTLWQPYAELVAARVKRYETRTWAPPAETIGRRLAVHAAAKNPRSGQHAIDAAPATALVDPHRRSNLELGAVVATATLSGAWEIRKAHEREDGTTVIIGDDITDIVPTSTGDYTPGRWVWHLTLVDRLDDPIYRRGGQRIWYLPAEGRLL